jgi:Bifunctional DNA primase/polymerase, N-terminal
VIGNRAHFLPGLDIRGEGGQVVAPPSIHPETGREYQFLHHPSEGIASGPPWLLALLTAKATAASVKEARKASGRPPSGLRRGDVHLLLDEMKRKFPIPGPGNRHGLMTRVVGSLAGRGYTDDLIVEVAMGWWKSHYADGKTSTSESAMLAELDDCLESTRANKSFRASMSGIDHRTLCRAIELNDEQESWLEARVVADDQGGKFLQLGPSQGSEGHLSTCKRGTQISQIKDRLCFGADERVFVTALIVHAMYKRFYTHEATIKMTHAQLREIIQDRHPRGQEWRGDNKQIGRLKKRFITQQRRPAEKYELLRETRKGKPGIPSEYEPTGIEFFLQMAVERAASMNLAA